MPNHLNSILSTTRLNKTPAKYSFKSFPNTFIILTIARIFAEGYSIDYITSLEKDLMFKGASQVVLVVKNLPAKAGDVRDLGLIPGSGRSPGKGNGNPLQSLARRIPWTEEPDGLQSMGSQRVRQD